MRGGCTSEGVPGTLAHLALQVPCQDGQRSNPSKAFQYPATEVSETSFTMAITALMAHSISLVFVKKDGRNICVHAEHFGWSISILKRDLKTETCQDHQQQQQQQVKQTGNMKHKFRFSGSVSLPPSWLPVLGIFLSLRASAFQSVYLRKNIVSQQTSALHMYTTFYRSPCPHEDLPHSRKSLVRLWQIRSDQQHTEDYFRFIEGKEVWYEWRREQYRVKEQQPMQLRNQMYDNLYRGHLYIKFSEILKVVRKEFGE